MNHLLSTVLSACLFAGAVGMTGCASSDDAQAPSDDSSADDLRYGQVTYEHPEVGQFIYSDGTGCTATLLAPRLVITAGHCFHPNLPPVLYFELIHSKADGFKRFEVQSTKRFGDASFVNSQGYDPNSASDRARIDEDIALVLLKTAVPASIATPAALAKSRPASGSEVTLYGMGRTACVNGARQSGVRDNLKRKVTFRLGQVPTAACPGDSGGPLFANGQLFGMMSIYHLDSAKDAFGHDVFAHPYNHLGEIVTQAAAWNWGQ